MKEVRYDGNAHKTTITEDEFGTAGVKSKSITWEGNGDVQEVANEAADWLVENDTRFSLADDDPKEEPYETVAEGVPSGEGTGPGGATPPTTAGGQPTA